MGAVFTRTLINMGPMRVINHVNAGVSEFVAMPPAVPIHCAAPAPSASDCVLFPPAMQLPTAMPDPQHKQVFLF